MKRNIKISIIFILLGLIYMFPIPRPDKKKEVGVIIGQIELNFSSDWNEIRAGKSFYSVRLHLINKFTNKKYHVTPDMKGLFCFFNLPEGYYVLTSCDFDDTENLLHYWINDIKFGENGIIVGVHANTVSVLKPLYLKLEIVPGHRVQTIVERINAIERVKNLFDKKDSKDFWKEFEYGDFEINE